MINSFFIAGTDTNVGKTLITGFFFRYFFNSSLSTITQKWIQTGSNQPEEGGQKAPGSTPSAASQQPASQQPAGGRGGAGQEAGSHSKQN